MMSVIGEVAVARLHKAGMRSTRQRLELAELLFSNTEEAVTAEALHARAIRKGIKVSLATVYGTLHSFRDVGLVREVSIDSKRYFDTNVDHRQYFYFEEEKKLVGVSETETGLKHTPPAPEGRRVSRVDIVVRLRRD